MRNRNNVIEILNWNCAIKIIFFLQNVLVGGGTQTFKRWFHHWAPYLFSNASSSWDNTFLIMKWPRMMIYNSYPGFTKNLILLCPEIFQPAHSSNFFANKCSCGRPMSVWLKSHHRNCSNRTAISELLTWLCSQPDMLSRC